MCVCICVYIIMVVYVSVFCLCIYAFGMFLLITSIDWCIIDLVYFSYSIRL